jgi:hypothetical protein
MSVKLSSWQRYGQHSSLFILNTGFSQATNGHCRFSHKTIPFEQVHLVHLSKCQISLSTCVSPFLGEKQTVELDVILEAISCTYFFQKLHENSIIIVEKFSISFTFIRAYWTIAFNQINIKQLKKFSINKKIIYSYLLNESDLNILKWEGKK